MGSSITGGFYEEKIDRTVRVRGNACWLWRIQFCTGSYDEKANAYTSVYDDSVYAAMCYCPIADIENADLAYAWMRYDSTKDASGKLTATAGSYDFTEFQLALQQDEAYAFAEYINSLQLKDENGDPLSFDVKDADGKLDLRAGSYYKKTLENISDALNAALAVQEDPEGYLLDNYGDTSSWLTKKEDGTYAVTDLAASVAKLLKDNYERYSTLDGFDQDTVDTFIDHALTGEGAEAIANQEYLVNATHIMLDIAAGKQDADIAKYWRTSNGTADQHTSVSVAYNITRAAQMAGADVDYALVWAMGHGSNEGTTTGTFVDWIKSIV